MAGFLRKKSKQDSRTKSTQALPPPQAVTSTTTSTVPPLYARFASSNNAPQEPQRIISSPMVLSGTRKDGAPAPQSRGGRTVAGNSVNVVRRDTREIETKAQRHQSLVAKVPETQPLHSQQRQPRVGPTADSGTLNVVRQNTNVEARMQWNQPSSAATVPETQNGSGSHPPLSHPQQIRPLPAPIQVHPRARPISRVSILDKPLPPSFPQSPNDSFSSNSPTTPTQASVVQNGRNEPLRKTATLAHKPLPRPSLPSPRNIAPPQRRTTDPTTDPETLKHNRTLSPTSPPDLSNLIAQPQSSPSSALPVRRLNDLPISPLLNNQTKSPHPSSSFAPDHIPHLQTLTPQPLHRSLSRQDLQDDENGLRSESGVSTSEGSLVPNNALAAQHQRLLDALQLTELNDAEHLDFRSPVASSNATLPEISFVDQDLDTSFLPSSSNPPVLQRESSSTKPMGQSRAIGSQPSVPPVDNPLIATSPVHTSADVRESHNAFSSNMGVKASTPDVPRFHAYRVLPQVPVVEQSGTLAPLNNITPQQPRPPVSSPSPSRPPPTKRSAELPPPLIKGKPLIFAAMTTVDQDSGRTPVPGRTPSAQAPISVPSEYINPLSHPPQLPSTEQGYSSPPPDFSYPQRKESLAPSKQFRQLPQPVPFNQRHTTPRPISPPKDVQLPPMGASAQLQTNEPATRRSPSKIRKLSKARTAGKSTSELSTASIHSYSSATSIIGPAHRTPSTKGLPATPASSSPRVLPRPAPAPPPNQIDDDVGIPLDDDPFANIEGVKVVSSVSRPGSPIAMVKGRRSKSTLRSMSSRDELSADYHSIPERKSYAEPQVLEANLSDNPSDPVEELPIPEIRDDDDEEEEEEEDVVPDMTSEAEEDLVDRLTGFLSHPDLLRSLLPFISFYEWCLVLSLSRVIRHTFVQDPQLRETVLERFLRLVGYTRWVWEEPDPVSLSLQNLSDYMRGVSTPTHEYARVAGLYVHSLSVHPNLRDESLNDTVKYLSASCRGYSRVVLRLRAQAEKEASIARAKGNFRNVSSPPSRTPSPTMSAFSHSNQVSGSPTPPNGSVSALSSPLYRLRRAPLLRVFVPSPDGDWLSDRSVLACEAECRRAGITGVLRVGDVVWDVAVGDEGNVGRLVWDGSYLIDLDYTYSPIGDLPKYMPTLAFPPSYFHRVIRLGTTSTNPIAHIDLRPWGEEIAHNLQLLQDRVRTETPQGNYHNVVRWVNRSSFVIRPPHRGTMWSPKRNGQSGRMSPRIPIPESNGLFVDSGWYGTVVVETEGTNEALADLQDRCGPGAFPPRPQAVNGRQTKQDNKNVFRILREKSRPGEIWIRAVSAKERLL